MSAKKNGNKYIIRIRDENSGNITKGLLTPDEIIEGLENFDMNLEDIGVALLNHLRESRNLNAVVPIDDDVALKESIKLRVFH